MTARDIDRFTLAELIHVNVCHRNLENCEGECDLTAKEAVAAGWSKPRTVTSAAELDALPVGSVILVDAGRYGLSAWQKHANGRWCEASHCEESMTSLELWAVNLPATVLFTPDGQP